MPSYLDREIFSDLVRAKRGRNGLRKAAPIVGISPSTISRIERGAIPDMATFLALCDWLKIEPAEFIKNTERKEKNYDYSAVCLKLRADTRIDSTIRNAIATLIEAVFDN